MNLNKKKVVKGILGVTLAAIGCITLAGVIITKTALDSIRSIQFDEDEEW